MDRITATALDTALHDGHARLKRSSDVQAFILPILFILSKSS